MKKIILVVVIVILVAAPLSVFAFSWKGFSWWKNTPSTVQNESAPRELTDYEKWALEKKYQAWDLAVKEKNIRYLLEDESYFTWTEEEMNYLIAKLLLKDKNKSIRELKITLNDGEMALNGYIFKPVRGGFKSVIKPVSKDKEIDIYFSKLKLNGVFFPKFVANMIVSSYTKSIMNMLYNYPDYKEIQIEIKDHKLTIKYL
ncbi:MAG: hypothetical protein COX77_03095 [Candidatus Komeilibacteria bacterium CG_4_10_14_0_2_um_filter_37_10]|uniref:Uncharacterized protein n=1 Tax=Candidatus Komeilibacteria bacterium CG_4_10_14_0_2_um_filter_37_10 TaxID=1974470 RepID=A0A2M7VEH0_9BACT|nr:MAG: hypothetical protein COX77_03095 [Candidatus Komeilibacteria bacterium CG_4_10_14_0_2_um_filter_37_10]PJA92595.1 MAG: hypothetical protein CO133_02335 [Candidatus Komeilibacteria bacterium CG_4_9_14_3_um_filter_37_5]